MRPIDADVLDKKIQEWIKVNEEVRVNARNMEYTAGYDAALCAIQDFVSDMPDIILRDGPLTPEQLRHMNGQPVWVEFEDGSGGLWGIVHISVFSQIIFPTGLHCTIGQPYYGKTYMAYAYPPAHIDRKAWKPCGYCKGAKYVYGHISSVVPNGDLGQIEKEVEGDFDYCPICGHPMTEEAWAELEKRLRG